MLYRSQLRDEAVAALVAANTDAADRVFSPRDWPTFSGLHPAILVKMAREQKNSLGRTIPQFNTTAFLLISARVNGKNEGEVEEKLDRLCEQIENAILTSYPIVSQIQQFTHVDTQINITAETRGHSGEAAIEIGLEFYECFDPITQSPQQPVAEPLEAVDIHADTVHPFDPNGAYDPAYPAPRTSGPDGRDEGRVRVEFKE